MHRGLLWGGLANALQKPTVQQQHCFILCVAGMQVGEAMSSPAVSIYPTAPMSEAAVTMLHHKVDGADAYDVCLCMVGYCWLAHSCVLVSYEHLRKCFL